MRRRSLFAGVGATVGLAGCLGRFTGRETVEEKPSPDPPDDLTRESVLEYVRTAEKAHVHNEAVDDDVNDVSVACEPFLDRVVDGTFYVVVHCGGSVEWRDGWLAGHGDIRTTGRGDSRKSGIDRRADSTAGRGSSSRTSTTAPTRSR